MAERAVLGYWGPSDSGYLQVLDLNGNTLGWLGSAGNSGGSRNSGSLTLGYNGASVVRLYADPSRGGAGELRLSDPTPTVATPFVILGPAGGTSGARGLWLYAGSGRRGEFFVRASGEAVLELYNAAGVNTAEIDAGTGRLRLKDAGGQITIELDGSTGTIRAKNKDIQQL